MAERNYVVDASVAGRWYVNNPPHVEESRRIQADADHGRIEVLAPENLLHEVTSVVHQAVFSRRLSARQAREQLERFLARETIWLETNELVLPAWDLSIRYGCSYYDAIYLEVARRYSSPSRHSADPAPPNCRLDQPARAGGAASSVVSCTARLLRKRMQDFGDRNG